MSTTKKTLMLTSAILMIASGLVTGILCAIVIFSPEKLTPVIERFLNEEATNYESVESMIQLVVSFVTAGSVVGIVFGGISIKFALYSSIEFYQKRSVVLTIAIICTIVVNLLVGILYIIAVMTKDEDLKFEDEVPQNKVLDVDKVMEKIEKLNEMKKQNLINDEEFARLKADILKGTALEKEGK